MAPPATKVLTPTGTTGVPGLPADFPSAIAALSKSTDQTYIAAALNVLVLSADLTLYLKVRLIHMRTFYAHASSTEIRS